MFFLGFFNMLQQPLCVFWIVLTSSNSLCVCFGIFQQALTTNCVCLGLVLRRDMNQQGVVGACSKVGGLLVGEFETPH